MRLAERRFAMDETDDDRQAYRWQLELLSAEISEHYEPHYVEEDQLLVARLKAGGTQPAP